MPFPNREKHQSMACVAELIQRGEDYILGQNGREMDWEMALEKFTRAAELHDADAHV